MDDAAAAVEIRHPLDPRTEDFPVQPVASCGFILQPFGFFDQNPTLDVPPAAVDANCCA